MKRPGLIVATALFVLLTGLVLAEAGWLSPRGAPRPLPTEPDALSGEAALRYRGGQPTHWRSCVLQR